MTIAILFILLFTLLFFGVPIAFSLGLSSLVTILFFSQDSLASVALKFYESMQHYTLLAIPFFILSSGFLTSGGVARRLIDLAISTTGHLKGGVAIAGVVSCIFFAALSGSSPATVVAIGSIAIAAMVKAGYKKEYAAGLICNSGTLGILIPPSIVLVVYGAATDTSVGKLFMAGVIPGILAGLILAIAIRFSLGKGKLVPLLRQSYFKRFLAFKRAFFGLLLIVIILGGIYGGIFTPTEAAAVAAVYAWFVALFIYKDIGPFKNKPLSLHPVKLLQTLFHKEVVRVMIDSAMVCIMLMFIIANAMLFAHVLTTERVPQEITQLVIGANLSPIVFLIVVNVLLLVAGNFMEPSAIILIMAPILFPIAINLGVDPIHLGIIMTVNMEIGLVTPPVGLNLFVTAGVTGMSMEKVIRASLPWLLLLLLFLIIITYIPQISLFLPKLLYGAAY